MLESKFPPELIEGSGAQGYYDYIIAGTGCAGLSLVVHMIQSGQFSHKKILLVDKERKTKNDRTWCFWETGEGLFESIVHQQWKQAWFHSDLFSRKLLLSPYTYKLVRGIDFYNYCFDLIGLHPNIDIRFGEVQSVVSNKQETFLLLDGEKLVAGYIFNSILFEKPVIKNKEHYLLQHFKGWIIEADREIFNPAEATLMDFRVNQQHGTAFIYVMPFGPQKALIEYTLFTGLLLSPGEYDNGLKDYISERLKIGSYKIREEEFGVIPMTNYKFPVQAGNIINIGTAGGQTKASSGYTFRFIQKHSAALVDQILKTGTPFLSSPGKKRYRFYDSTLLHILSHNTFPGYKIFTNLFKKNKPQQVLRFLDNESSLSEELKIISSLQTWPFLKAALKQL